MAAYANYVSLLLLGFILLGSEYSTPVMARLSTKPRLETGQDATEIQNVNTETDAINQSTENKENDSTVFQCPGVSYSPSGGGRVSLTNSFGGPTIRAHNPNKPLYLKFVDEGMFIGEILISKTNNDRYDKPMYQKTSDGTSWYTNLKVGEPMTKDEIDVFEKGWTEYETKHEAEMKEREAMRKKRHEQREKERRERREKREAERKRRNEERERRRKAREEREKARKDNGKKGTGNRRARGERDADAESQPQKGEDQMLQ